MAPLTLNKLINLQNSRLGEMQLIESRFLEKPKTTLNKAIVQSRVDAIKGIWDEVCKTHASILSRSDTEDAPYLVENTFSLIQAKYEDVNDPLLTACAQFEAAKDPTSAPNTAEQIIPKLSRLPLPTFSAKYEDWESFCDLFTFLVHDNLKYSEATKLQFLKSCLKDSAAELVAGVKVTNVNYASTWAALKARYFNPPLIIFKHFVALMQLPYLKKESAAGLRTFADEAQRIVRALTNLKLPVKHWDLWFIFILSERLDPESRKLWKSELSVKDRQVLSELDAVDFDPLDHLPTFSDLVEFLERRAQALNMLAPERIPEQTLDRRGEKRSGSESRPGPQPKRVFHTHPQAASTPASLKCAFCGGLHSIYKCFKFKAKCPEERWKDARRLKLCFNCLGQHLANTCHSAGRCSVSECGEKHHTLIHRSSSASQSQQRNLTATNHPSGDNSGTAPKNVNAHTASISGSRCRVTLATAQVGVLGSRGNQIKVRALFDQGSEASFISESIVQLLELPRSRTHISLAGIGGSDSGKARAFPKIALQSLIDPEFQIQTEALILPRLTSQLPDKPIVEIDFKQFEGLPLADPGFTNPSSVDLILGAEVYGQLLRSALKRFPPSYLLAQNTVFGWVASGSVQADTSRRAGAITLPQTNVLHCVTENCLDSSLQRFWELEEVPPPLAQLKPEDQACEDQTDS